MTDQSVLREIESASLRAWPALEEHALEGWTLRCSQGFTRRANSVQSVCGPGGPFAGRVDQCEEWYDARAQPCTFRLTPFSEGGLDEYLAGRGYELVSRTHVLQRDVAGLPTDERRAELREVTLPEWLETFGRLSREADLPPAFHRILKSIGPRSLLAVLGAGAPPRSVGCGLAVLDQELLGLFDLVIDPEERRRGYGGELVRRMISWGVTAGASRVYLQVTEDNPAALQLYGKLGFHAGYDYWYRIRPQNL